VLEEYLRHVVVVVLALWNTSYSNLDSVEGAYSTGLASVHQELLELLRVVRHLPHDGGGFHEVGAGTDDVEDFHRHELHLYLFATNCTNSEVNTAFTNFSSLPRIVRIFTNC